MMIELDCGCEVEVTHTKADRYVKCQCQREWVIRSEQVIHVTHTVKEVNVKVVA
jgi:hypothetical protein